MNYSIVDIVFSVIFLCGLIVGYRKGLYRSLMSFVVIIASVFIASFLSNMLADKVTEMLYPKVKDSLMGQMNNSQTYNTDKQINSSEINLDNFNLNGLDLSILKDIDLDEIEQYVKENGIPEEYKQIAESFGFTKEDVLEFIEDYKSNGNIPSDIGDKTEPNKDNNDVSIETQTDNSNKLEEPKNKDFNINKFIDASGTKILRVIVRAVLFVLIFIVTKLVLGIVVKATNIVFKLPFLHLINGLGGAIFYFAGLFITSTVFAYFINTFNFEFVNEWKETSIIFNILLEGRILNWILGLFK